MAGPSKPLKNPLPFFRRYRIKSRWKRLTAKANIATGSLNALIEVSISDVRSSTKQRSVTKARLRRKDLRPFYHLLFTIYHSRIRMCRPEFSSQEMQNVDLTE